MARTPASALPTSEPAPLAPYGPLPEGGRVRPVVRWGDPVMHRRLTPVTAYDEGLRSLVADLVATMYAADGVGLAACQIGVDASVFVFDCPDADHRRVLGVVCNPVLELPEGEQRVLDVEEEGCLSLPGAFVDCGRPDQATVRGQGLTGQDVVFTGDGLLARCLQHESDHLSGTVFGDRLNDRTRKRLYKTAEKRAEHYPPGWPATTPDSPDDSDPDASHPDASRTDD